MQTDTGGYQILASYLSQKNAVPVVPMKAVLSGRISPDTLAGKVILIGLKADSNWGDRYYTPYSHSSDTAWAGVELHANLAAELIAAAGGRSPLRPFPTLFNWGWVVLWSAVGVACTYRLAQKQVASSRYGLSFSVPTVLWACGLFALSYGSFLLGYWLLLATPLLSFISACFATQADLLWHKLRYDNQILEQAVAQRTWALETQNQNLERAQLAAETANRTKSAFLAHMSHELRTPLTAILGFGELLARSPHLPQAEADYAQTIGRCGDHLLALINNVLELSKIESDTAVLTPEAIHLSTFLSDIRDMFQVQAAAKQVNLQLAIADTLPSWIEIDANRLRQIVINLLGNAVKFTQQGHVTLQAECGAEPSAPLRLTVEDTGPGLTKSDRVQLFERFVQTEAGVRSRTGTGLGLALTYQHIALMDGEIEVFSTYGAGSRFVVQLPIKVVAAPLASAAKSAVKLSGRSPQPIPKATRLPRLPNHCRVLIVDDDENNRHLLTQWLQQDDIELKTADTGRQAISIFERWRPHLILLDIHLPEGSGYEVARRIRGYAPASKADDWLRQEDPIILAITAGVLQDSYADLLAAGCDDVIWKPLKSETLMAKIEAHL